MQMMYYEDIVISQNGKEWEVLESTSDLHPKYYQQIVDPQHHDLRYYKEIPVILVSVAIFKPQLLDYLLLPLNRDIRYIVGHEVETDDKPPSHSNPDGRNLSYQGFSIAHSFSHALERMYNSEHITTIPKYHLMGSHSDPRRSIMNKLIAHMHNLNKGPETFKDIGKLARSLDYTREEFLMCLGKRRVEDPHPNFPRVLWEGKQ